MSALANNTAREQGPRVVLRLVEEAEGAGAGVAARTDAELVDRACSGDRAAWACLYERFAPMVHAVLLSRVDPADADDLAHDVFVKAMRRLPTLREPGAVGPWLATAARNRATSLVRWRLRLKRLVLARPSESATTGDGLDAEEVLAAIRSLPEAYRETLLMRLAAQMSGPEIAARTGLSHGSVRVNLARGMKLLRERLGGSLGVGGGSGDRP